ncbi:hypothetical protein PIB30_064376, partial [Stylosanthes scabra]|nr:hypothetical protein [Stylosanthes scabra]
KAYARRQHVWLTGANEVDSKTFTRAILAKTVVCIPLLDGVVEFGTIDKVQEDIKFIQHVKSFFIEHHHGSCPPPPKPALSEHSTSNPASSSDRLIYTVADPPLPPSNNLTNQDNMEEDEEDDDEDDDDEEEEGAPILDSEYETRCNNTHLTSTADASAGIVEPSELMQLEMSEDIRVGSSPNDGSNNLDSNFHLLAVTETNNPSGQVDSYRIDATQRWDSMQDPLGELQVQLPSSSVFPPLEDQILAQEDDHYSQTVSSILQNQSTRWADSPSIACYVTCSNQSAFAKWTAVDPNDHLHAATADGSSQWLLKYILFTVPYLHSNKNNEENNSSPNNTNPTSSAGTDRLRGGGKGSGTPQDELSANHVLAERRRREKLNERFIILRSLVPFVTKMDKASILGDTIEYVKQLRRKIQDLEARNRQIEAEPQRSKTPSTTIEVHHSGSSNKEQQQHTAVVVGHEKRKVRIVEGTKTGTKAAVAAAAAEASVQVSIIESDALLELECNHREGLLLDVMLVLRDMKIEVIGVQSSLSNGVFVAELRAKVKENNNSNSGTNGKKVSIVEVKKALNQVIPHI